MEKTEYGSLIAFTHSGSELRENIVRTIASKIKDDYCLLQGATIQNLDDIENALIDTIDGEVVELFLNDFKAECKTAISDHKV
jgi:chromosomal replication initiation ATPase DnaA